MAETAKAQTAFLTGARAAPLGRKIEIIAAAPEKCTSPAGGVRLERGSGRIKNLERQNGTAMRNRIALREGDLNQEGSVNDVEVRRRMLWWLNPRPEYFRRDDGIGYR
jgi:hypothetical protein